MKVNLFFSRDVEEPYADIHTNELTDNIQRAINLLEDESKNDMLPVKKGKDITFLEYDEIFMIRVEDKEVKVYTQDDKYAVKKALYQVEESLNESFVRISKTTIVNITLFYLKDIFLQNRNEVIELDLKKIFKKK